jgi:excisionase family DNA binding protein
MRDSLGHLRRAATRILKGGEKTRHKEVRQMLKERLLRPREVASRLAVSRSTVYRWFWEGRLKGVKLNSGTVRILESSVTEKLAEAD